MWKTSGESQRNEENVPHFFQSMLTAMQSGNIAVHVCIGVNITTLGWEIPVIEYRHAFPLFSKNVMYLFELLDVRSLAIASRARQF